MDYRGIFEDAVDTLRQEKRYRVFADLERVAGHFPKAIYRDQADNAADLVDDARNAQRKVQKARPPVGLEYTPRGVRQPLKGQ